MSSPYKDLDFAENFSQILANAKRFDQLLKERSRIGEKVKEVLQWYYFDSDDLNCFAPSKFIGYKDNPAHGDEKWFGDGRETELLLSEYFKKINPSENSYQELYRKLCNYLNQFGWEPRLNVGIHIRRANER